MKRVLLVVVIGCLPVLGQTPDAVVIGRIQEPSGNPVASVRVTLTRQGGNNRASVVTNNDGSFRVASGGAVHRCERVGNNTGEVYRCDARSTLPLACVLPWEIHAFQQSLKSRSIA